MCENYFTGLDRLSIEEQNEKLKEAVYKLMKYIRDLKNENIKLKTIIRRVEKTCRGDGFGL